MYKYAQLNEDNVVTAISELHSEVLSPYMILINDRPDIGLIWRYIDGQWHEPLPDPESDIIL